MSGNIYEWISISELAKRKGVTSQTIRNNLDLYETMEFKRGTRKGYLVKVKRDDA